MGKIRHNTLLTTCMLTMVLSLTLSISATDTKDLNCNHDSLCNANELNLFANMTKEAFREYNDSVYNSMYPSASLRIADSNNIDSTLLDNAINTTADLSSSFPIAVDIDRDKEVGQIPIISGTNQFGAKTYDVPIDVFPGNHEMTPQISLSYNSLAGNSFLGMGWTLAGIPCITREPSSIYYNGETGPVALGIHDILTLDGVKLLNKDMIVNGNELTMIYESEYGNIVAKGHYRSSHMIYFEVFYPDGRKAIFGDRNNSTSQLSYPITEMTDLFGNQISYHYTKPFGTYRIESISYNGASVRFVYSTREDVILGFCNGEKLQKQSLLTSVECRLGTTALRTYRLTYTKPQLVSLLTQIDYEANGSSLNPLRFHYGEVGSASVMTTSKTQLMEWYESSDKNAVVYVRGKFDYSIGDDGLACYPNKNPYWLVHRHPGTIMENWFENKYSGKEKILLYTGLSGSASNPMPNIITESGFVDIICADLYGNQEENIIKINNTVSGGKDVVAFSVYGNLMGSYVKLFSRTFDLGDAYEDDYHNWSVHPKYYYTGDFNGDGRMDVMAVSAHQPFNMDDNYEKGNHPSICYVFDLVNSKILYNSETLKYHVDFPGTWQTDYAAAANNSDKLFVIDSDGDGKSELCHITSVGTDIYKFNPFINGEIGSYSKSSYTSLKTADLKDKTLLTGDFNGDGLADLVLSPEVGKSAIWYVYCSTGDGKFERHSFSGLLWNEGDEFIAQDVNGDGISDIVRSHEGYLYTHLFSSNLTRKSEGYGYADEEPVLIPVDINAHSKSARLLAIDKGIMTKYSFPRNDIIESLITGMVNSLGVVEKNKYSFINSEGIASGIYTHSAGAVFPFVNLIEAIPAIVSVKSYMNGEMVDKTTFEYENAVFHRQGRGFRGFGRVTTTNLRGDETYRTYDVYGHSMLTEERSPTYHNTYVYKTEVEDNKVARISLREKQERDLLKGITISTSVTSDEFGFPVETTSRYTGDITIRETVQYEHSPEIGDGYNLGLEKTKETVTNRNGSSYTEKEEVLGSQNRQPKGIRRYKNNSLAGGDLFQYDSCGNMTDHVILPYACQLRNIAYKYEYDNYGRIVKESDYLGLKRKTTYDSRGNISRIQVRRGSGSSQTHTYDGLDRLVKTVYDDGTFEQTTYKWESQADNGLYSVTNESASKPTTSEVFDAMGRTVRQTDIRFDGTIRKIDRTYDSYGNLYKVSLPFTGESASYWNTYSYDSYNRITAYIEASGKKTTYSYSGLSETTVEDNVSTKRTMDALGNLISCADPGGTVTYQLAGDGQPISITAPGNAVTTFRYNGSRMKIGIDDPSKGITTYEYDMYGNVSREVDANGDTITYKYDKYCRITEKTCPEFTAHYTYDFYGNLVKVGTDNGVRTIYKYDEYGRIISITEYASDQIKIQRDFSFENGNISQITYSTPRNSSIKENRTYSNGHLVNVSINGTNDIFTLQKENAFGIPTVVVTGPITREYYYSAYGFPIRRKATNSTSVIQDFSYEFDPVTGNLKSRTDNTRSMKETFSYDGLNRLISCGDVYITYDNKGNIISKSDIGSYSYGLTNRPYILTGIPSSSDVISSTEQTVEYTSFNRPSRIKEGRICYEFKYNADYERVQRVSKSSVAYTPTDYYLGGIYHGSTTPFTDVINISSASASTTATSTTAIQGECLYLGGDYYDAPAVLVSNASIGDSDTYYILRDYLGSITHLVKSSGELKQEMSYDAWGMLRDPETHEGPTSGFKVVPFLSRGYAGHEHWASLRLINMNARLYDPAVGRFLSPDPLVQMPDMTQNFNRYSYCLNNPLRYVDEDGEFFWAAIGIAALIGATTNVAAHWSEIQKEKGWKAFWKGFGYAAIGGAAGGLSAMAGIGTAVGFGHMLTTTGGAVALYSTGIVPGAAMGSVSGAVDGFLSSSLNSLFEGNSLKESLKVGGIGALSGAITGAIAGGIDGGVRAYQTGRNVWSGNLKNKTIVERIGEFSNTYVNETGHVGGSKKHSAAKRYMKKVKALNGSIYLEPEFTMTSKDALQTIRVDVLDDVKKIIYDYKFGYTNKTIQQLYHYQYNKYNKFTDDYKIIVIRY